MAVALPGFVSNIDLSEFGSGPGGHPPNYTATQIVPTTSTVQAIIDAADLYGILLFMNFSGGRQFWTDPDADGNLIFNWNKYEARVRLYEGLPNVANAIARRRILNYTIDEPEIAQFAGSIPKTTQNDIGLLHKSIWPGCLTVQRSNDQTMSPAPSSYVSRVTGVATGGGWTGVDYGIAQWNRSATLSGLTRRQWFQARKAGCAALNIGMVPGQNWIDGGDGRLWDYLNTGTSSGRVQGTTNKLWLSSPDEIMETADATWDDLDAAAFLGFTHVDNNFHPEYLQYQNRSDFVAAWGYMLNKFATRPTFNGFRTAKGDTTTPPPSGTVFRGAADRLGTRRGARKAS